MPRSAILFLFVVLTPFVLASQTQTPAPQPGQDEVQVQDGGTRQVPESIAVPPMVNAPFTARLRTEWVRRLADGWTMTVANDRRMARDTNGRIYRER